MRMIILDGTTIRNSTETELKSMIGGAIAETIAEAKVPSVTIADGDLLEIEGTDYLVLAPREREILVTREKATGHITVWAWDENGANGWFSFLGAEHEYVASYALDSRQDPGWRLYLAADVIGAAVEAGAESDPADAEGLFSGYDFEQTYEGPGIEEWYDDANRDD